MRNTALKHLGYDNEQKFEDMKVIFMNILSTWNWEESVSCVQTTYPNESNVLEDQDISREDL
jgi:hypothetical protein